jgi:hypothetical protein
LNLQGDELTAFVSKLNWQLTGDSVQLTIIEENQAKPKKIAEQISLERKLLLSLSLQQQHRQLTLTPFLNRNRQSVGYRSPINS